MTHSEYGPEGIRACCIKLAARLRHRTASRCLLWLALTLAAHQPELGAQISITIPPPTGLSGQTIVMAPPGGTVVIYSVGLLSLNFFGSEKLNQIEIMISPLAAPLNAGLVQADFTQLRLVESTDLTFGDADDVLLNTIPPASINVAGGVTTVTDAGNAALLGFLQFRAYFIAADIAATATDGDAFRLGAATDHIATSGGSTIPPALQITASNANRVVINQLTPLMSLSTSTLAFGTIAVDSSASLPLLVSNAGAADMNVTSIVSNNPQFVADLNAFTVTPAGNRLVTVTFTPNSPGLQSGTLAITFNPTVNVNLNGFGASGTSALGKVGGRVIPVGLEWMAGLGFLLYGFYKLLQSKSG